MARQLATHSSNSGNRSGGLDFTTFEWKLGFRCLLSRVRRVFHRGVTAKFLLRGIRQYDRDSAPRLPLAPAKYLPVRDASPSKTAKQCARLQIRLSEPAVSN